MKTAVLLALGFCATAGAQVHLPQYQREVLPNGVIVDLIPRPGLPLVQVNVVVKGGAESDPRNLPGVCRITSQLLRRGTMKRTSDQFSEELDSLGGEFDVRTDEQSTEIESEFLKKDFARGLDLASDAVLHPEFPESEVQKEIARTIDSIKTEKDNAGRALSMYAQAFFFGAAHPYGRLADESTLARVKREDLVTYHDRMYTGRNMVVLISGDFDANEARKLVRRTFGSVPTGEKYEWTKADLPSNNKPRMLLVDKPDATQTYFEIQQPGIERTNTDRVTLMIIDTLFGGRFTSMLNDSLRVNSGLTYGARSRLQRSQLRGVNSISTYTRTDTTERAIDMALDVLKRLRENGITATQLASAKGYIKGTYPTQHLETPDQISATIAELEVFGLDRSEVDNLFERIDAVTLDEVNKTIRKYYAASNLTFVIVGNGQKIRQVVTKYAPDLISVPIAKPGWGI